MISTLLSVIIFSTIGGTLLNLNHTQEVSCPSVMVSCALKHCDSSPFYFRVQISNAPPYKKVSYQWSVSTGRIVEGQGTATIKVVADTWHDLTARVEVKGLPAECGAVTTASMSVIRESLPPIQEIEQFGSLPFAKVKLRLDKLADQLRNRPGARGFILSSRKWPLAASATDYLIIERGFEAGRIVYAQRKRKGPLIIKLLIVPTGVKPPGA